MLSFKKPVRVPRSDGTFTEGARIIDYRSRYYVVEWTLPSGKTKNKKVHELVLHYYNGRPDFVEIPERDEIICTTLIHSSLLYEGKLVGTHWEVIHKFSNRAKVFNMDVESLCLRVKEGSVPLSAVDKYLDTKILPIGSHDAREAKTLAQYFEETLNPR